MLSPAEGFAIAKLRYAGAEPVGAVRGQPTDAVQHAQKEHPISPHARPLLMPALAVLEVGVSQESELERRDGALEDALREVDDEAAALKKAKRAWNKDIQFGRGDFTHRGQRAQSNS